MKFKSIAVATEIFSGDFCDYKLKPNRWLQNNVYKHCCKR